MVIVVPMLGAMFAESGQLLPLPTRIVIAFSNFLKGWGGLILLISIIGFIVGFKQWRKTEKGLRITDALALKMPVMGDPDTKGGRRQVHPHARNVADKRCAHS